MGDLETAKTPKRDKLDNEIIPGNENQVNSEGTRNISLDTGWGLQNELTNETINPNSRLELLSRQDSMKGIRRHTLEPIFSGVALDTTAGRQMFDKSGRKPSLDPYMYQSRYRTYSLGNISDTGTIGADTEQLPSLILYRGSICEVQRPTLFQLRQDKETSHARTGDTSSPLANELKNNVDVEKATAEKTGIVKFGWKQGVFLRALLNIFGVMLFLRLSWMAGQAGIGYSTLIVALSVVVTSLTTMSMSAICTNGEVKGGGTYYIISRSLGPEFGGSIGIVFSIANAVGAAMHILGFAETVRDIMWENDAHITSDPIHDVRVISLITCCLCLAVVLIGMAWESKAQMLFLFILVAALVDYFIGTIIPPNDEQKWKGFVGYKAEILKVNFVPHFTPEYDFFKVFAIFFPSATGILAGANISGDLKNPSSAIPKGTFLAILCTTIVYLGVIWTSGSCMVYAAVGALSDSELVKEVAENVTSLYSPDIDTIQECWRFNKTCKGGLLHETGLVGLASGWRPLIIGGIFSATLSSALASMVSAPKVFQALCRDKLFPYIHVFGKEYGANGEPKRAYILCFIIASGMVCIGSLNTVAPIISNFFLMSYTLINFACFDASMANSPGFRPGFKYYNKWLSLLGALLCLASMFLMNWWGALLTIVIVAALHTYVRRTKPDANWGSSTQANVYNSTLKYSLKLVSTDDHVKNFRPQILLLSGYPKNRANLVDFAATITKKQSLLICGHIFSGDIESNTTWLQSMAAYKWFNVQKIKSFYSAVCAPTFRIGVQVFLQTLGLGKLRPNTLLIGYKCDWLNTNPDEVFDYFNVIQDAFDLHYGVGILRVQGGFDKNKIPDDLSDLKNATIYDSEEEFTGDDDDTENKNANTLNDFSNSIAKGVKVEDGEVVILKKFGIRKDGTDNVAFEGDEKINGRTMKSSVNLTEADILFRNKHYGTIDVWWLYDDGGLTLLVPFILHQRKQWKNCKLRVFFLASAKSGNEEEAKESMALLLSKFRIIYSELIIITDANKKPQLSTYNEFESIIYDWRLRPNEIPEDYPWKISDTHLLDHKRKTYRTLRLREKLLEYSKDASLIVMTLPVPRKACPAGLYMGFLETLTRGMPPILLLRGNQQSVLTYLS